MDAVARAYQTDEAGPDVTATPLDLTSEAVLQRHLPLVREVARSIARHGASHYELDELVSWGMEGLLDAHRRFQPEKHASFRTYARFRIRGVILDNLRARDLLSRTARRKAVLLERTRQTLEATLGRQPGEHEVADALGMELQALRAMAAQTDFVTISLADLSAGIDDDLDGGRHLPDPDGDPLRTVLHEERVRLVAQAVRRLPDNEHAAVMLYYRGDLTMREVGNLLGLSESRVSQLHTQAMARLRRLLPAELAAHQ